MDVEGIALPFDGGGGNGHFEQRQDGEIMHVQPGTQGRGEDDQPQAVAARSVGEGLENDGRIARSRPDELEEIVGGNGQQAGRRNGRSDAGGGDDFQVELQGGQGVAGLQIDDDRDDRGGTDAGEAGEGEADLVDRAADAVGHQAEVGAAGGEQAQGTQIQQGIAPLERAFKKTLAVGDDRHHVSHHRAVGGGDRAVGGVIDRRDGTGHVDGLAFREISGTGAERRRRDDGVGRADAVGAAIGGRWRRRRP